MAREPSYPEDDAPVAGGIPEKSGEKAEGGNRKKRLMTGAAIGIGSAALVAALLYANRARKSDKS